jgi:hypothetical protein
MTRICGFYGIISEMVAEEVGPGAERKGRPGRRGRFFATYDARMRA